MMEHSLYYVFAVLVSLAIVFFVSCCCSEPGSVTTGAALKRVLRYLAHGRITIAVAVLLGLVEFFTSATGTKESARIAFGLPNDNPLALLLYAQLHGDGRHLYENVTWLLICGPLVERRMGPGRYALFLTLAAALGGYLLDTLGPFLFAAHWEAPGRAVGFSIAGHALLVPCISWMAMCAWEGGALRRAYAFASNWWSSAPIDIPPNPLKWPLEAHQVLALTVLIVVLLFAISDGHQVTLAGHRIGLSLGLVLAAYCFVRRYMSRGGGRRR